MKEDYEVSCKQLEKAIEAIEKEISLLVKENQFHSPWTERLKEQGNIPELSRGLLVVAVEEIIVLDAEHIKIHFQYQDKFQMVLQMLEAAMSVESIKEKLSQVESTQVENFLLAAKEG